MLHPEIPSCKDCQEFAYNLPSWTPVMRGGGTIREKRPANSPTPCHQCPKIPFGKVPIPANAIEMSDKNWRAWQHYMECKAIGEFPADALVRQNAGTIRRVEDSLAGSRVVQAIYDLGRILASR